MNNIILPYNENIIDTSKIKDFQRCPRYFFYHNILGWDLESPNNHLIFGSAWHLAMEHLLLNGYGQQSVLDAYDKFLNYYRRFLPSETDDLFGNKTPDIAFTALGVYASNPSYRREFNEQEVLYTEIAGKVMIDENFSIAFRMDSILKDKLSSRIFSREHKTGSYKYLWDEGYQLDLQPYTYSHVLYCLFPFEEVDKIEMNATFFMSRKKDPIELHRLDIRKNKDQMQVWLCRVRYLMWEIKREYDLLLDTKEDDHVLQAFPLKDTNCIYYNKVCPFMDFCLAWPNPLQRAFEPPIGFIKRIWNPLEEEAKTTFNFEKKEY
jgi:hypothetical protein